MKKAKEEYSDRLSELFRVAKSILHHIDAISGLRQALPMQNEYCEEEAKVDGSTVLIGDVKLLVKQNGEDECHLDHKHKDGSVININLIVNFESVLFFILFHERTIRYGVHVCCQLHLLGRFLIGTASASRFLTALSVIHTRGWSSIAILKNLLSSILLALGQRGGQKLDLVSKLFLILVWLLRELFHEHLFFLPFSLTLSPV